LYCELTELSLANFTVALEDAAIGPVLRHDHPLALPHVNAGAQALGWVVAAHGGRGERLVLHYVLAREERRVAPNAHVELSRELRIQILLPRR